MRKAQTEEYDAVVIAAAGLIRLGRAKEITEYLPFDVVLPDPGQGALAVEIRAADQALATLVSQLDHQLSRAAVTAERAFLGALGGGCRMPIGAYANVGADALHVRGMVASLDGMKIVRGKIEGNMSTAEELGTELAQQLLREGGAEILGIAVSTRPLRGQRILITRAQEQASALEAKIRALGGEPVEFPAIRFAPLEDFRELDAALARAGEFDWIVFTSVNGVRAVAERLDAPALTPGIFGGARLAAIGPATAGALKNLGLHVDFVPTKFLGKQIAIELPIQAGQRALLLRADIASETLSRALAARGVNVTDLDAYRTIMPPAHTLNPKQVDAVTFTSSSTVRNLVGMLDGNTIDALDDLTVFCIGPVTAETARELGLRVDAVAKEHTIDGLVSAMVEYYQQADLKSQ
jgi:hydroxymethylbilane synthase